MVVVPEGHKIVVYEASAEACLRPAESGVWVLQFGDGSDPDAALNEVEAFFGQVERAHLIWILAEEFLSTVDPDPFLDRVRHTMTQASPNVRSVAVFAAEPARHRDTMRAFSEAGLHVRHSASDGGCFAEVHRPDGVVLGYLGEEFKG